MGEIVQEPDEKLSDEYSIEDLDELEFKEFTKEDLKKLKVVFTL